MNCPHVLGFIVVALSSQMDLGQHAGHVRGAPAAMPPVPVPFAMKTPPSLTGSILAS